MPEINIPDMDQVDLYPKLLDPGVGYLVNIQELPVLSNASTGNPQIELTMTVLSGPEQKEPSGEYGTSPVGRKIKDFISLKAKFRIKQLLIAAGLLDRADKNSEMAKGNFNTDKLMGAKFSISLEPKMYEGKEGRTIKYAI